MTEQRFKSISIRLAEVLIALLLVLAAFGVIVMLVNSLFPAGSGLVGLFNEKVETSEHGKRNMVISVGDYEAGLLDIEGLTAVLDQTQRTVKRKPAEGIVWDMVAGGAPLFDQDAVQTFRGSETDIVFDKHNRLRIGENSLVIVQRLEKDMFRNERRSQVVVVDGELSGTLGGAGEQGLSVEVTTANAVARVSGAGAEAQFSIKVNPDKSSTLTVFSGAAELTSMGQKIMIKANQSATSNKGGILYDAEELPPETRLQAPEQHSIFYYRKLPPQIQFRWEKVNQADSYRLEVAKDAAFKQLIVDEAVTIAEFSHGNLREGDYYWRVKALRKWAEGPFGKPRHLRIEQDRKPPALEVLFPDKFSETDRIILTGSSEAGAQVFVADQQVTLNETGGFSHEILLQQGVNVLVVEATDEAGNVSYQSHMVYGKF